MNKFKNKKIIIILILIIILIIILVIIGIKMLNKDKPKDVSVDDVLNIISTGKIDVTVQTLEDGTKLNTSRKLEETKRVGNLEISNPQLTSKNGKTTLFADVKNVGSTKVDSLEVEIVFIDKNNNVLGVVNGVVGTIESGKTTQLNVSSTKDYVEAYDYMIKIK